MGTGSWGEEEMDKGGKEPSQGGLRLPRANLDPSWGHGGGPAPC